jgi:hypothetical protein
MVKSGHFLPILLFLLFPEITAIPVPANSAWSSGPPDDLTASAWVQQAHLAASDCTGGYMGYDR